MYLANFPCVSSSKSFDLPVISQFNPSTVSLTLINAINGLPALEGQGNRVPPQTMFFYYSTLSTKDIAFLPSLSTSLS